MKAVGPPMAAPPVCWLASYPKSGNTWFRLLALNAQLRPGRPGGLAARQDTEHAAASRPAFEEVVLVDSHLLRDAELDALRPDVHRAQAQRAGRTHLVKCHDAYTRNADGEPLLGGRGAARGALLLVRDPRDVVLSLAAHLQLSVEEALALMDRPDASLGGASAPGSSQLRQRLLTWSAHALSWLDQDDLPVQLIRYEDLQADTAGLLQAGLRFARIPTTAQRVRQAVASCSFMNLQAQESAGGFAEARHGPFFRSGRTGQWRQALTADQVRRLEDRHGAVMRRLGYALVSRP